MGKHRCVFIIEWQHARAAQQGLMQQQPTMRRNHKPVEIV